MTKPNQSIPYSQRRFSNASVNLTAGGASLPQGTTRHSVVLQVNDAAMGTVVCQVETIPTLSNKIVAAPAQNQYARFSTVNSMTYDHGTVIRITATPATDNHVLDHFEDGDGNRLNTNTRLLRVTVTKDITVRAVFRKANTTPTQYDLKVEWDKTRGSVTCSPALGADGSVVVNNGQTVTLRAVPKDGYVLKEWNGTQVAGKWVPMYGLTITQQIFSNRNITAVFVPKEVANDTEDVDPLDPDPVIGGGEVGLGTNTSSGSATPAGATASVGLIDQVMPFVKKWWWAILIAAYFIFKEKGGKQ